MRRTFRLLSAVSLLLCCASMAWWMCAALRPYESTRKQVRHEGGVVIEMSGGFGWDRHGLGVQSHELHYMRGVEYDQQLHRIGSPAAADLTRAEQLVVLHSQPTGLAAGEIPIRIGSPSPSRQNLRRAHLVGTQERGLLPLVCADYAVPAPRADDGGAACDRRSSVGEVVAVNPATSPHRPLPRLRVRSPRHTRPMPGVRKSLRKTDHFELNRSRRVRPLAFQPQSN